MTDRLGTRRRLRVLAPHAGAVTSRDTGLTVLRNAASEAARYVRTGLDRATAAAELQQIATACLAIADHHLVPGIVATAFEGTSLPPQPVPVLTLRSSRKAAQPQPTTSTAPEVTAWQTSWTTAARSRTG